MAERSQKWSGQIRKLWDSTGSIDRSLVSWANKQKKGGDGEVVDRREFFNFGWRNEQDSKATGLLPPLKQNTFHSRVVQMGQTEGGDRKQTLRRDLVDNSVRQWQRHRRALDIQPRPLGQMYRRTTCLGAPTSTFSVLMTPHRCLCYFLW